jgi:hypothetical protein
VFFLFNPIGLDYFRGVNSTTFSLFGPNISVLEIILPVFAMGLFPLGDISAI